MPTWSCVPLTKYHNNHQDFSSLSTNLNVVLLFAFILYYKEQLSWELYIKQRYSLPSVTFGSGVEGDQLHVVEVLRSHLIQNLFEGVELTVCRVHVVLVDL